MAEVPENVSADALMAYLERIPGYGFEPRIDADFAEELLEDFAALDVLEEVKAFRWYHDNRPAEHVRSVRLALRRWLTRTLARRQEF
ncbi:MAG: hypothetical protein MI919_03605 [Holophagales bacterium]|nr:hypothetical protein [Holophagales bacterium]